MLDMFKRPDDPPQYNKLYAIPGAAMLAAYAAGHYTGEAGWPGYVDVCVCCRLATFN